MEPQKAVKPKRQKKSKSRTEVFSDSESEGERKVVKAQEEKVEDMILSQNPKPMSDADVGEVFTKYYLQRATTEFAEDLDKIRGADDFKDDALPLLISALQQGTQGFSIGEQRKVVMAGIEKDGKRVGE